MEVLHSSLQKIKVVFICFILFVGLLGCNVTPNIRRGSLATTTLGIPMIHPRPPFLNPDKLGSHSYFPNPFEKNGIVYTCDGGHIDIAHVRANADDTRYLVGKVYDTLIKNKKNLKFGLAFEQSRHIVEFTYPENWSQLSQDEKEKIVREISLEAGAYVTFNATLWHEFMSWFGVHFAIIDPQFNSAFSWEDVYSNILGVRIAIKALQDNEHNYNQAVTIAINNEMKRLRVLPRKKTIELTESMRGKWFNGNRVPDMLRRNTDIGSNDGFISPVLIPGACEDANASPLAAPSLDKVAAYGFTVTYKIVPVYFEGNKALKIAYSPGNGKVIEPQKHYPLLIDYINKQAVEKYHYDIGK
jgi:hypothetical protein